jgi:small subunit ribosomal protein S9
MTQDPTESNDRRPDEEQPAEGPEQAPEAQEREQEPAEPAAEAPEQEPAEPETEAPEREEPDGPGEEPTEPPAGEPEAPTSGPPADRGEEISGEARPKAKDQPPGAELEPIAIEPERELTAEERARLEAEEEDRARLEAERASGDEPVARRGPQVEIPADARIQATGKRKSSIARVIVRPGSGGFEVNSQPLDDYFPRQFLRSLARQPLLTAGYESTVDVHVRVHGGGISGQAGAVRHGVARALCEIDPDLRPELKRRGLLTRDARKKERRKAGLKKARKRPQFSKR